MKLTAEISLRALAGVSLAASTEETRYYLRGVLVEISARQTIYVATDGHKLLAHHAELSPDAPDNTLVGEWIIPTAQCKAIKLKRHEEDEASLSSEDGASRRLTMTRDNAAFSFEAIDGSFPSWRRVLPTPGAICVRDAARFDWEFLADLCKAVGTIRNDKESPKATLKQTKDDGPAWLDFDDQDTIAVVMPMRSLEAKASDPRPPWIDEPTPAPAAKDAA